MKIVVEYLVLTKNESQFCTNTAALKRLFQVDARFTINDNGLTYQDNPADVAISYEYRVVRGEVQGKPQRFFQLTFSADISDTEPETELERFSDLLRAVKGVIAKVQEDKENAAPEVLWDDISAYYARKAYPKIQEVENLMRKLIANFMLTRVGQSWVNESLPNETKEALDKSKRKGLNNQLHTLDFKDLAGLLLTPYASRPIDMLWKAIKELKYEGNLSTEELQPFLPRSNWQRYFRKLVDCEDQYLQSRWKELYELRCKVAHNALFDQLDYERTCELADDLIDKLRVAIEKLSEVIIPPEEQEVVAEDAATRLYPAVGRFIDAWRNLEDALITIIGQKTSLSPRRVLPQPSIVAGIGVMSAEQLQLYSQVYVKRNAVVHATKENLTEEDLHRMTADTLNLLEVLRQQTDEEGTGDTGPDAPSRHDVSDSVTTSSEKAKTHKGVRRDKPMTSLSPMAETVYQHLVNKVLPTKKVTAYNDISTATGVPIGVEGGGIGTVLGEVARACHDRSLPPLTSIVVRADEMYDPTHRHGMPGVGHFAMLAETDPAFAAWNQRPVPADFDRYADRWKHRETIEAHQDAVWKHTSWPAKL